MRMTAKVARVRVIRVVFIVTCYSVGDFMSLWVNDSILVGLIHNLPRREEVRTWREPFPSSSAMLMVALDAFSLTSTACSVTLSFGSSIFPGALFFY
jgi:hypothetical protein